MDSVQSLLDQHDVIARRVQPVIDQLRAVYPDIPYDAIDYRLDVYPNNRIYARASFRPIAGAYEYSIWLHPAMLSLSDDGFFKLMRHEWAHIIAFMENLDSAHGLGWQRVMRSIGEIPTEFDTSRESSAVIASYISQQMKCGR